MIPLRNVQNNLLVSTELPAIRVQVAEPFRYIGKFEFALKGIAAGERYVFVDVVAKKIKRLFVFQFEGFLPDNNHTYNYDFSEAEMISGHRFRQNTWAYGNEQLLRDSPGDEGALTAQFVREQGFDLEDELIMSRFLTVPDAARRNELILFYLENASTTGYPISTFYDERAETTAPHWDLISVGLTVRSRQSFTIIEG